MGKKSIIQYGTSRCHNICWAENVGEEEKNEYTQGDISHVIACAHLIVRGEDKWRKVKV